MSYKSDAVELLAEQIDKETQTTTPIGKKLNIDDAAVEDVVNNVDVNIPSVNDSVVEDTDSRFTTPPDLDSSCGE